MWEKLVPIFFMFSQGERLITIERAYTSQPIQGCPLSSTGGLILHHPGDSPHPVSPVPPPTHRAPVLDYLS